MTNLDKAQHHAINAELALAAGEAAEAVAHATLALFYRDLPDVKPGSRAPVPPNPGRTITKETWKPLRIRGRRALP